MKPTNRHSIKFLLLPSVIALMVNCTQATAQKSTLVTVGSNGNLVYKADAMGNVVPDFSGVGYMNSEAPIPTISVVKTVTAIAGDNLTNIQNAIDAVAAMPIQSNGFRGAILFKAGTYEISAPVYIKASGIVLRGEGVATNFRATGTYQYILMNFVGANGKSTVGATEKQIAGFVPIGAKNVTVASGHAFQVGDWVHVRREPNAAWIHLLGMDTITSIPEAVGCVNWTAAEYKLYYERKIVKVDGNVLTLDAPMMDVIDPVYAKGFVTKFTSGRIENCAVENMQMTSTSTSPTDENHCWTAINLDNIKNAWVKNVIAYDFGYACVDIDYGASFVTVEGCSMLDPVSIITGGRRYCFSIEGQRSLVKNCTVRNGRHDYVTNSRVSGPNVFYNCNGTLCQEDMGPHQRYATGILYDNVTSSRAMQVQNRTYSGSGHGWAGSQVMFWNCKAPKITINRPPSYHVNWAIGCIGYITNVGYTADPFGVIESYGVPIAAIPSLFLAQLKERLTGLTSTPQIKESTSIIKLYPNPAKSYLSVEYSISENSNVKLTLINLNGQVIKSIVKTNQSAGDYKETIALSQVPAGMYIVELKVGNNVSKRKLIIE